MLESAGPSEGRMWPSLALVSRVFWIGPRLIQSQSWGREGEGKGRAAFPPAQQRIPSSNRDNQSQPLAFILRCEPRIASGDDLWKWKGGEKCLNYLFFFLKLKNNQLLLGKLYCGDSSEGHGALGEIREGCSKGYWKCKGNLHVVHLWQAPVLTEFPQSHHVMSRS